MSRLWNSAAAMLLAGAVSFAQTASPPLYSNWQDQGVIYLDHSLNARLRTVPVHAVRINGGFWAARRQTATDRSLPSLLTELEEHGTIDNFRRLAGHPELPRRGRPAADADLYKWLEAASWALASADTMPDQRNQLHGDVESLITHVAAAQDPSGYLDTYFTGDRSRLRFTDLVHSHEDFCLGHLLQAGIAYYRATGSRRLLDVGIRFADYVVNNFGPDKRPFVSGHPELEMALVELYRTTGQTRYLSFVRYLFSGAERDRLKLREADIRYMFSGRPFTSRTELEGHAVRALYAASGATDYFTESGDPAFKRTIDLLWTDLTQRKMYLTGGVGSRAAGESFGDPYELPNLTGYDEACAAVANVMWNYRLLLLTGDARYADVLERTLYNAVNAAMSLNGSQYCYRTPLASNGDKIRNPWYDVPCCPPNVERLLESLPGYLYSISREGVYVNLYQTSDLDWHLEDGVPVKIAQLTDYPWSGSVQLKINSPKPAEFTMYLRWPAWASSYSLKLNGAPLAVSGAPGSFVEVSRRWTAGDTLAIDFPMPVVPTVANPRVHDDYGRVALERGPLVYALEQIDQNGASLGDLFFRTGSPVSTEMKKDLLGGIILMKHIGLLADKSLVEEPLYQPLNSAISHGRHSSPLTLIPYYAIGNREPTPMEVWVPVGRFDAPPPLHRIFRPDRPGPSKYLVGSLKLCRIKGLNKSDFLKP